ncbi:AraC family transcriptional regulator [Silvimonas sp. JCM 19000]
MSVATARPTPVFWRDPAMPWLELRTVLDGRTVCYAPHTHETFSIGAITGGQSLYINGTQRRQVQTGDLVIINPEQVHACNPLTDAAWAYHMFYVDVTWLAGLQYELGFTPAAAFQPFATTLSADPALYAGLTRLAASLHEGAGDHLLQQSQAIAFFSELQLALGPARPPRQPAHHKLQRAADLIREQYAETLTLDQLCAAAELSATHLIRGFKQHFGMTPHAYLTNRRIQVSRTRLRQGAAIAEVAHEVGFADQAHLQRAFKQMMATTPGHYRTA